MKDNKNSKKIKNWKALVVAILVCQLAGIVGSFFTTSAIPTWYALLNKPTFSPPNWIFGPVWTVLYTLMGVAVYKVWLKKDTFALKVFGVHLILNSLWSIIFFGAKNLGFAFVELSVLWVLIIYIVRLFWKVEKSAGLLLLPYLAWVSFAMILNLSIWTLNPKPISVFAQDFTYKQAYSDYSYTKDLYNTSLTDFNKKKDSYIKNPTLSLKEELRLSLNDFLFKRNDLITTYLTAIRMKVIESKGLSESEKNEAADKVLIEINWYKNNKNNYLKNDTLETLLEKSTQEDARLVNTSTPIINFALTSISLGEIVEQDNLHTKIYQDLKNEANDLVSLKRADSSLFDRWFLDIENEFDSLHNLEENTRSLIKNINSAQSYAQERAFQESNQSFGPQKQSLLKINQFLYELENVVDGKR